jgi:hypothetical protein
MERLDRHFDKVTGTQILHAVVRRLVAEARKTP